MSPWVRIIFQIFALLFIFYNTLSLFLFLSFSLNNFEQNFYLFLWKETFLKENSSYLLRQIRRDYFSLLFEFQ